MLTCRLGGGRLDDFVAFIRERVCAYVCESVCVQERERERERERDEEGKEGREGEIMHQYIMYNMLTCGLGGGLFCCLHKRECMCLCVRESKRVSE